MMRTALAFVKKDFLVTVSYRFNFVLQIAFIFVAVAFFYFIGSLVDPGANPFLLAYGGSYFGFLLIGVAFADYLGVSISSFANNIREGQLTGTLELILISPTRLLTILLSSSVWSYLFTSFRVMVYLVAGVAIFGLNLGKANLLPAFTVFLLSLICFVSIGMIYAALVLVVKKGETAISAMGGLSLILSGILFPPDILPSWMAKLSGLIPFTYSLHGLRLAILEGHSMEMLKTDLMALSIFGFIFSVVSVWVFPYAVRRAKMNGTLTQY